VKPFLSSLLIILFIALLISTPSLNAMASDEGEWRNRGEVSLQWRQFENDNNDTSIDTGMLIFTRLETQYEDERNRHVFRGFARVDQKDKDRDFMSFEDVYFSRLLDEEESWLVLAGYKLYNWTATEAFHPADVINSRNFDSDIEYFEKKGELTLELSKFTDWGKISFFLWPRFEQPQFPGNRSRLGFGVDLDRPTAVDGTTVGDKWLPQGGVRIGITLDDGDLSLHLINHIDRNFPIIGTANFSFNPVLQRNVPNDSIAFATGPTPYYFRKTQAGGTLQYAFSNLLVKFEGAYRVFDDELPILTAEGINRPINHGEAALGFEYQLPFSMGGGDTSIFTEAGSILGTTKEERARLGAFQRDVLFGLRHSFNDIMGKELFLTMIHDVERANERLYNISYSQRLSDLWKIQMGVRVYDAPKKGNVARGLEALDGAHHVLANLTRFF